MSGRTVNGQWREAAKCFAGILGSKGEAEILESGCKECTQEADCQQLTASTCNAVHREPWHSRPKSGYMIFASEARDKVKEVGPCESFSSS